MQEYYFMNKNDKILKFKIETRMGGEQKCNMLESYTNCYPIGFIDIDTWVKKRNYAKHKQHLVRWLNEWNLNTLDGFIDVTHGLGLNDTLWIKRADSSLTWEGINLYNNDFTDIVSRTAFETGLNGLKLSSTSPEFTAEGSFAKCWIKDDDGIKLIKRGSEGFANAGLEPYSEYYATDIAKRLCKNSVSYDLVKYKGYISSECRLFTTEKSGFVPMSNMLENKSYDLQDLLELISKLGYEDEFREMIVLDSIILNEDRHTGNFGFMVDNDTYKITGFAPIFDHNLSLISRGMMEYELKNPNEFIKNVGHRLGGDYTKVGRAFITEEIKDNLRKLIDYNFIKHPLYNLPEERLNILNNVVNNQISNVLGHVKVRKRSGR